MTPQEVWEYTERRFDWGKVHRVMTVVGWEWWHSGVPSVDQLKDKARDLIFQIMKSDCELTALGSGGLYVERYSDDSVELRFVLEQTICDGK